MNKLIALAGLLACGLPLTASAQEAMDALQLSQTELRGTARFQSMAGAFGALGGDLSSLGQNPGGIGVYRSSDMSLTLNGDFNKVTTPGTNTTDNRFTVPSVGYVGAFKLGSETMPYFNIGFSYNRVQDFHRHYSGMIGSLPSSLSNYIASGTGNYSEADLSVNDNNDPYYNGSASWGSILAYNSYIINNNNGVWQGLMGENTTGSGEFQVDQWGHTDEYNINIGGNVANTLFWGMGVGITDLDYEAQTYYGEQLNNAWIYDYKAGNGRIVRGNASFGITNYVNTTGTGYNFKLGVIVKPVNEVRLGFAFHTPTYYDMHDVYKTYASYGMDDGKNPYQGLNETGTPDYYDDSRYRLSTPWRVMGSIAGVIGQKGILSLDYEWQGANTARVKDDAGHEYADVTASVKNTLQASHIVRLGGEYRLDDNWSVRAGYSYQTSPVKSEVLDGLAEVITPSTSTSYETPRTIQHITAGVGYHYKHFYLDLAYVHKERKSDFNAFSPVPWSGGVEPSPSNEVKDSNNRAVVTLGFRF